MKTIKRSAEADWNGNLTEGHGLISTESNALTNASYALKTRFEGGQRENTNPEELIGAAAASCFSMALSKTLVEEGAQPSELRTRAQVGMVMADDGPTIRSLDLEVEGIVPSLDETAFQEAAKKTSENCPVMRVLRPGFDEVTVTASLVPA